ncbi:hypothetical protein TNCV_3106911 [Trichonephila clavipes]|nr:hypothetical protein TNCV_3106911 [Trichonephila clavipes]
MPFGLSEAAPNFQKAIDRILKPVLERFVSVYMDDVIITSPSFTEHVDHLNHVFTLLEQLIQEQRTDPELGHIYRYLENPDDGSVNATVCEGWSQDFKLTDGLLLYAKYCTTLEELRVYIPQSLREAIMNEFHDQPLAGHLGKKKTYLKLRDTSRFKESEELPEEQRSTGINSLPQNSLRRRSLSVEALDGDPADRST